MVPKVAACVHALRGGVSRAHILNGTVPHALLLEVYTDEGVGTMITEPDGGSSDGHARFRGRPRRRLDAADIMQTYARKQVLFVRGDGMRLYDDDGREYLDFVSGIGAVNLGHAHPAVAEAICEQSRKLVHVSNLFYVEHRAELAADVVALLGGRLSGVLRELGCRGGRGRDQARAQLGRATTSPARTRS